jgi:16S rRNA (cytidine1402-2'-O)-methyltransferase
VVLFEAPHRLCTTLDLLAARFATRTAAVCRELTKLHEEVRRDTLEALAQRFRERESVVGETVLVIAGAAAPHRSQAEPDTALAPLVLAYVDALRCEQGDPRRAVARLARQGGGVRRELVAQLSALGLWDR